MTPTEPVAAREERYPLSPVQAGMLFNRLSAPQSGVDIPLAALLTKLTIEEMAKEVTRMKSGGKGPAAPTMKAVSRDAYRAKRARLGGDAAAPPDSKGES